MPDEVCGNVYVFVQQQRLIFPATPFVGQLCTFYDMQRVEFQSIHAKLQHALQGNLAMFLRFTRQADDEMSADLQAPLAGSQQCRLVLGKAMPAVDAPERLIEGGLQSQFQPDLVALLLVGRQQLQHRFGCAIRARPDGETNYVRFRQRLVIECLE